MDNCTPLTTALRYHQAWASGSASQAAELLGDDLLVDVPLNTYSGKHDFVAALAAFADATRGVDILGSFENGDEACLIYDMQVDGLNRLRVAEHFKVDGGLISAIRQIHDTAELRRAGFGPRLED